jgi:hypothetical protein
MTPSVPSTRWLGSKASAKPIEGLTKSKMDESKRIADEVKRTIREIFYMCWLDGED